MKRALALLLTASLSLSLAACGGGGGASNTGTPGSAAPEGGSAPAAGHTATPHIIQEDEVMGL